jgi:TPR repeat protein
MVYSSLKHENEFYRVKKGDLFEALSRCYKQGIVHATSYVEGRGGLPKDHMKAVEWWHKAADQGYAPAPELFESGCSRSNRSRSPKLWPAGTVL